MSKMKILVINSGSSSIKFQLFDAGSSQVIAGGSVARIGEENSYLEYRASSEEFRKEISIPSHHKGFEVIFGALTDRDYGVVKDISEITAVGHRVVHGGDAFTESTLITEEVIKEIKKYIPLATLHNPPNLLGIQEVKKLLPNVPQVAVFDTSFHQTIPKKAYLYALPYRYYQKHQIRKYGFHGTSCRYVSQRAADILEKPLNQLKLIVCHLGNGVTINAVHGRSVDTSMGLTPLEGAMMGTRSGDIDPGVILFLSRELNLSVDDIDKLLNEESGLLGISGVSNDVREILEQAKEGNSRCKLAIEMFAYRIKKYIGAYIAALGGVDALVFTAGIGENAFQVRSMICKDLESLGIILDEERNQKTVGIEGIISSPDSKVTVLVIPTDEEKMIALDTLKIVEKSSKNLGES